MISSIKWIPQGVANPKPMKYEVTISERNALEEHDRMLSAAQKSLKAGGEVDRNGLPLALRMDDYGEDYDDSANFSNGKEDPDEAIADEMMEAALENGYSSEEDKMDQDENVEMSNDDDKNGQEESKSDEEIDDEFSSDEEDFEIKESDKMVVVAQTDEEFSTLEVYLYDEEAGSLYVHHDISLPAFPLCVCWLGCGRSVFGDKVTTDSKNYVAVGTFNPEIEIWNLDVVDALEPSVSLGLVEHDAHKDAVMNLAWNENQHHLLASSSADRTVKLWDLSTQQCVRTYSHHTDKVQSVAWNPVEVSVLLSGSFDRSLAVFDAKMEPASVVSMQLSSDVECAIWNPHRPEQVLASTEDGYITCFDVRNVGSGPLYSFQAHKKPCAAISISRLSIGLLASCSADKTVRLWDLEHASGKPHSLGSKSMAAGALFDCAFDLNDPFMLATGGDEGALALWDVSEDPKIEQIFKNRTLESLKPVQHAEATSDDVTSPVKQSSVKKNKKKKKSSK